jgi:uncharacterized membrane protein
MIKPINFRMISHPMNWVTLMLMVLIAGAIGHYFLTYLGIEPQVTQKLAFSAMPAGQSPGEAATGAIEPQSIASGGSGGASYY